MLLGAAGVFVFAVTVYAGLAGTDTQTDNLAPTAVYVGFWVGIPFLTLLLGDVFRLLSPWRAIGRATGWLAGRVARGALPEPLPYPDRLGHWPAAAGLVGFAICELCWAAAKDPRAARHPDARLPGDPAGGDEPVRRRVVDAPRRRLRRLVLAPRPAGAGRPPGGRAARRCARR